mmetsp:Transcript_9322/g.33419  ORF Transcript_9322/g.33419 Transcript_9322/m.33419 type:complete len:139 (+) Transcript_9322:121-537(+)
MPINPVAVLKVSTGMTSGYALLAFFAPGLAYKLFFKGGLAMPGKVEDLPDEADKVHKTMLRWFGFALGFTQIQKAKLTNGCTENTKGALETDTLSWMIAGLLHADALSKKTQPKDLCLMQMATMPVIGLACFLASRKA